MDKTKANAQHADFDSRAGQPGDMSLWQREMFKKFVAGGGLDNDTLAQPYVSSMPWPYYPQHLWSHPLFQQSAHPTMPQSPAQMHEQEKEHAGQENGTERLPSDKAKPSHNCETSGSSAGTGCHPYHKSAGDLNYDDFYNMGGTRTPPYNHPGGFMFPMPPHPGQLDPLMLWMQHMRRQAAYVQSITGHRNGYQSPLPVLSGGPSQRGFIKIPSGVPQKQTQLWETQSSEKVQLWATVTQLCATLARAEAEIFCQRGKISKLEDDLEMMKTRQDALSEALKGRTISSQTKRERRKRTAAVPVAILGLPALQPCPLRAQVKKARGIMNEGDPLKHANELASEANTVRTHQNALELTNGETLNGNGNCPMIVGLTEREGRTDSGYKDHAHGQQLTHSSCVDTINSASRQENGSSKIMYLPNEQTTESHDLQNVGVKQECINEPSTIAAERSMEGAESNSLYSGGFCRNGETIIGNIVCATAANVAQQRTDAADAVRSEQSGMHNGGNSLVCAAMVSSGDSNPSTLLTITNSLIRPSVMNLADVAAHGHHVLENNGVDATAVCDKEAEAMTACSLDGFDGPDEWTEGVMEVLE